MGNYEFSIYACWRFAIWLHGGLHTISRCFTKCKWLQGFASDYQADDNEYRALMAPSDLQGLTTDCSVYTINRFHWASRTDSQFPSLFCSFWLRVTEKKKWLFTRAIAYIYLRATAESSEFVLEFTLDSLFYWFPIMSES